MALATKDQGINWLIRLIMAVLVVVLSFVIVKTVITFANPESAWKQPAITPAVSQNIAARGVQNFSFRTDPFNREVAAAPELLAEVGQDAPETTLNLKLTGRTTAKTSGTVIILTPDNKTGNYRVGDEIVPGVILEAVNKDFVVLDVDGQIQRLTFERGEDTSLIKRTALDEDAPKTTIQVKAPNGSASAPFPSEAISGDVSTLFQNISLRPFVV